MIDMNLVSHAGSPGWEGGSSGVVGIGTCLEKLTEHTSRYKILLLSRIPSGYRTVIRYATRRSSVVARMRFEEPWLRRQELANGRRRSPKHGSPRRGRAGRSSNCRTPRVENLETGNCRKEGGFIRRKGGEGVVCEG